MEPQEVHNICRFCLCQDEHLLRPITRTLNASLTLEDVGQFTGIKINAKESMSFAICFKCADTLRSCASFRQSCMNNDAQFQELLEVLIASSKCILTETVEPLTDHESDPLNLDFYLKKYDCEKKDAITIHNDHNYCTDSDDDCIRKNQQMCNLELETYSANRIDIGEYPASDNEEQECHFMAPGEFDTEAKKVRARGRVLPVNTPPQQVSKPGEINTKRTRKSYPPQQLCCECGKLVTNIAYHNQTHRNEKKHACPHCPLIMRCRGNLVRHINAVHFKNIKKTCKLCSKAFTTNYSLASHMLSTHGIGEKIQCMYCPRLFNEKSYLKTHMARIHSNVRSFECDTCGKLFKTKLGLKEHMRVHSTEQPYQCSKCPKRFKSRYAKKIHETTHSGIVFECEICDKTYRYKSLLNIHIRKQHPKEANAHEEDSEGHSMSNT